MMTDALRDRWIPRSRAIILRERAGARCWEEKRAAKAIEREERRRALPGYDGDCPERMQGALRLR
jgi:hypothetical protein